MEWGGTSPPACYPLQEADLGGPLLQYPIWTQDCTLSCPALTRKPDVYIPETLEPGRQVTAICVFNSDSERCPAPTFSWVGAALSYRETRQMASHVSVLTLTPRPEDHGTDLTCRVHFRKGLSTENTIQLNVACEFGGGHQGERHPPGG